MSLILMLAFPQFKHRAHLQGHIFQIQSKKILFSWIVFSKGLTHDSPYDLVNKQPNPDELHELILTFDDTGRVFNV